MNSSRDDLGGYSTLLVAVDLTAASDRVLKRAALLPLCGKARLTLLHVIPGGLPARTERRAVMDARKALAVEARQLAKSVPRGVTVVSVVTVGTAAAEIAEQSAEARAELIVMGRTGGRGFRDMFLGSTAERVIRRTQLPVLVVRLPPRAPYSRPALALDTDEAAGAALAQFFAAIPAPRPRVTVVHAYDTPYRGLIHSELSEDSAEEYLDKHRRDAARKIGGLLAAGVALAKVSPLHAPTWNIQVQLGTPRLIIARAAKKSETDLLVMGTRGHSGLAYAFLGTVAGDLLRTVSCDVLVVPPTRQRKSART